MHHLPFGSILYTQYRVCPNNQPMTALLVILDCFRYGGSCYTTGTYGFILCTWDYSQIPCLFIVTGVGSWDKPTQSAVPCASLRHCQCCGYLHFACGRPESTDLKSCQIDNHVSSITIVSSSLSNLSNSSSLTENMHIFRHSPKMF